VLVSSFLIALENQLFGYPRAIQKHLSGALPLKPLTTLNAEVTKLRTRSISEIVRLTPKEHKREELIELIPPSIRARKGGIEYYNLDGIKLDFE
jgi:hypothetical protein